MGRCYIFLSIFLAQLISSYARDGASGSCNHKGVRVLRTENDVDWTNFVMPFFSGFFGGGRQSGCACQLTTPSPREICPTNATMNVTNGQHSWWKGSEMRRYRTRRHAHRSSRNKMFRKSISLKEECPVRVPLRPCPEKLVRGKRSPHRGGGGRGGGGRGGGRWGDSSEEQGSQGSKQSGRSGKYYYKVTIRERGDSGQIRCIDPKTKQTKVLYDQGGTTSVSTVMVTSTVYNYGTREYEEEDDSGDGEQGDDYLLQNPINTSPISGVGQGGFTIFPTRTRQPFEPSIKMSDGFDFSFSGASGILVSTPFTSLQLSDSTMYAFTQSFAWPSASEGFRSTYRPADIQPSYGYDSSSANRRSTWSSYSWASSQSGIFDQRSDDYSTSSSAVVGNQGGQSNSASTSQTTAYNKWKTSSSRTENTQISDQSSVVYPSVQSSSVSTNMMTTDQYSGILDQRSNRDSSSGYVMNSAVVGNQVGQSNTGGSSQTTAFNRWKTSSSWVQNTQSYDQSSVDYPSVQSSTQKLSTDQYSTAGSYSSSSTAQIKSDSTSTTIYSTATTALPDTWTTPRNRRTITTPKPEDATSAAQPLITDSSTSSAAREIPLISASSTLTITSQATATLILPSSSETVTVSSTKNNIWKVDVTNTAALYSTTATTNNDGQTTTTATAAQVSSPSRSPGFGLMDLTNEKGADGGSDSLSITKVDVTTQRTTSLRSTSAPQVVSDKYTEIRGGLEAWLNGGKTSPASEANNFGTSRADTWAQSESSTMSTTSSSVRTTLPLVYSTFSAAPSDRNQIASSGTSTAFNLLDIVNNGRVDEKNGRTGQSPIIDLLTTSRSVDWSSGKEITYNGTQGYSSGNESASIFKNSTPDAADHSNKDIQNYLMILLVGGNSNCNCSDRNSKNQTGTDNNNENGRTTGFKNYTDNMTNSGGNGSSNIFYIGFPVLGSAISAPVVKENKTDCAVCPNLKFLKVMQSVQTSDCISSMFGSFFK